MTVSVVQALDRQGQAPQVARGYVRDFLGQFDPTDLVFDVELVVSELVTNAVLHGAGEIRLRLEVADGAVSVGVIDGGRGEPRSRGSEHTSEGGRGLALVARLTQDWGIRPDGTGGKEVWAVLPLEATS